MKREIRWLSGLLGLSLPALIIFALGVVNCGTALGQDPESKPTSKPSVVDTGEVTVIEIHLGTSRIIRSPWPVSKVSITAPEVADVHVLTPQRLLVLGKSVGETDVILWGKEDDQVWRSKLDVSADIQKLKADMASLFPDSQLTVSVSGDLVVIGGTLARAVQSPRLRTFMESRKLKYMDMTRLAGVQQVQIQVRVAEVSRQAIRALGISAFKTGSDVFGVANVGGDANINIGTASGVSAAQWKVPFTFQGAVTANPSVTMMAGFPEIGLELFINALQDNQYLRLLAEPTLVALSGEEASFLVGGEFPIPVVQGGGTDTGAGTSITIEYREFGVRLKFRPTVLGNNLIRLKVAPEVSELSESSVSFGGFVVPGVTLRKAETTLEMRSGQTFAMAGLINRATIARVAKVPGLGDVPILGALFRSVRYTQRDTEMIVLVKATLVSPVGDKPLAPLPGVLDSPPNDWELYAEGRIEGRAPAKLSPADATWLREMGLDRLKGSGAWASYGEATAPSRATPPRPGSTDAPTTRPVSSPDNGEDAGPKE